MQRTVYDSGAAQMTARQAEKVAAALRDAYPAADFQIAAVSWSVATAKSGTRRLVRLVVQRKKGR